MNKKTNLRSKWLGIFFVVTLVALAMSTTVFGGEAEAEYVSNMYATAWSLVPPLVAIILALITKEVYSSLFIGILTGALMYSNFSIVGMIEHTISIISSRLGDNGGIIVFLIWLNWSLTALLTGAVFNQALRESKEKDPA